MTQISDAVGGVPTAPPGERVPFEPGDELDEAEPVHRGPRVRPAVQRGRQRHIHGAPVGLVRQVWEVDPY